MYLCARVPACICALCVHTCLRVRVPVCVCACVNLCPQLTPDLAAIYSTDFLLALRPHGPMALWPVTLQPLVLQPLPRCLLHVTRQHWAPPGF